MTIEIKDVIDDFTYAMHKTTEKAQYKVYYQQKRTYIKFMIYRYLNRRLHNKTEAWIKRVKKELYFRLGHTNIIGLIKEPVNDFIEAIEFGDEL